MRILLIVLSDEASTECALVSTGSFATAYYLFRDASIEMVLASRSGGYLFLDNSGMCAPDDLAAARRFQADRLARNELADTICLDDVHAEDFDGAMCLSPSTSDSTFRLPDRASFLISGLVAHGKPVAVLPPIHIPLTDSDRLIASDGADSSFHAAKKLIDVLNGSPGQRGGGTC